MDKETIIKTVQSMRDYIHRLNQEEHLAEAWDEIMSADHLIEELKNMDTIPTDIAVSASISAAEPYLNNLAALRGALQSLVSRNRGLEAGLHHVSSDICFNFTKDFLTLYNAYLKDVIFPGGKNDATV